MYVFLRFFTFFFKIQKNMTFYVFLSCCTRFPEQCVIQSRQKCGHCVWNVQTYKIYTILAHADRSNHLILNKCTLMNL